MGSTCVRQGCGHSIISHHEETGCTASDGDCECTGFLATRETLAWVDFPKPKPFRTDQTNGLLLERVHGCARCGGDHDEPIYATKLDQPFAPPEAAPVVWTHWFPCPTNGQPVMLKMEAT